MARVKRAVNAHKKRRVVLERASGYRGQRSRLYRKAKEQPLHSMTYAYRDRKDRKGAFRRLWIQRINAAARADGMTYNRFIQGLQDRGRRRRPAGCSPTWRSPTRRRSPRWSRWPGRRCPADIRRRQPDRGLTGATRPRDPVSRPAAPQAARITSIRSPRVKAARQLAKRAFRERTRLFLAEGPQAVREALGAARPWSPSCSSPPRRATRHADLAAQAAAQGVPVHAVSGEVMAELAQTVTPQGLLAVCRFIDVPLPALTGAAPRLVVMLANVRDPGNAGTVLRTADAAGADGVIFSGASVDPYNSKCVRASAGSLFHLPVVAGRAARRDGRGAARRRAAGARRRRRRGRSCWTTWRLRGATRPADRVAVRQRGVGAARRPAGAGRRRPSRCPSTAARRA